MRRVAIAIALLATFPFAASAASTARLHITDPSPLAVRGTGFRPLERVTVTAFGPEGSLARTAVATRAGAFTVRFAASADWCSGVREVRAVGRRGSRAVVWTRPALTGCAAP